MAGLSKRFCDRCEGDSESFRGRCGGCLGTWDNCDSSEENCGHWQDPACTDNGGTICGDGHECPLYVDITFTLHSFIIQGDVCCGSTVPLSEPCWGRYKNPCSAGYCNPSVISPWGGHLGDGLTGEVEYQESTHHIRLTRGYGTQSSGTGGEQCFCFYGGYWSGNCDCNTCCCETDNEYPDCPDADVTYPGAVIGCFDIDETAPCEADNACYPITTGWASSLDVYGGDTPSEQGGSTGQAMCTVPDTTVAGSCGYTTADCGEDVVSYSCWECGTFNPHHIEAYMSFTSADCVGSWQLEIKGLTEQARSQMGASNLGLDCSIGGVNACSDPAFGGYAEPAWGYIGRWWGKDTHEPAANCNPRCDEAIQSGDGYPQLRTMGCACPPHTSFSSTVTTTNAIVAFHPTSVYYDKIGQSQGQGGVMSCAIADETNCGRTDYLTIYPSTPVVDSVHYGKPTVWDKYCEWCNSCCEGDYDCEEECACGSGSDCACPYPDIGSGDPADGGGPEDTDFPRVNAKQYPCSHCTDDGQTNPTECFENCDDYIERICADCDITINPNSNPLPAWVEA